MMDRQNGDIIFECDHCGDTLDTETGDFSEAWAQAKSDGWNTRKVGSDWFHSCPGCHQR